MGERKTVVSCRALSLKGEAKAPKTAYSLQLTTCCFFDLCVIQANVLILPGEVSFFGGK